MAVSRAGLLRGRFRPDANAIRPPWALVDAQAFASACDACGRCGPACPEGIIAVDRIGRPQIDFAKGGCSFCGACADRCPTGALSRVEEGSPWSLVATIGAACLSLAGTDCRMCQDHCDPAAIRFRPLGRGRWLPTVEEADCTGCGACVAVCPVGAVSVVSRRNGDA